MYQMLPPTHLKLYDRVFFSFNLPVEWTTVKIFKCWSCLASFYEHSSKLILLFSYFRSSLVICRIKLLNPKKPIFQVSHCYDIFNNFCVSFCFTYFEVLIDSRLFNLPKELVLFNAIRVIWGQDFLKD